MEGNKVETGHLGIDLVCDGSACYSFYDPEPYNAGWDAAWMQLCSLYNIDPKEAIEKLRAEQRELDDLDEEE